MRRRLKARSNLLEFPAMPALAKAARRRIAMFALLSGLCAVARAESVSNSLSSLPSAGRIRAGSVVQLTADGSHYAQPVWSPDGQWIAFAREGFGGIEIIRPDGTGRRLLVSAPRAGYRFAWSPDASQIGFLSVAETPEGRRYRIQTVEIGSGRIRTLWESEEEFSPPVWQRTASGQRLAFMAFTDPQPNGWRCVTTSSMPLKTSLPNGSKPDAEGVLFYRDGHVWISSGDAPHAKRLSREGGLNPAWSPDRRRVVFSSGNAILMVNADGSELRELARGHHPAWSPDGLKLVFDVARDDGHRILSSDLWLINADGSELTALTQTPDVLETEPSWSPEGRRIAYRLEDTGQICVLSLVW